MSLELIPANSIGVEVGIVAGLPLVYCSSKQLVCCEKNRLMIRALSYLQLLFD
jgi:hypothetical protein